MKLSIIIINWKSVSFLHKCLLTIYDQTQNIEFEIIVVDNASYDGCQEMIAREFSKVKFVQCEINLGFANANNLGFQYSSGDILVFLNPDTEILKNALNTLYSFITSDARVGAVGCILLNSDLTIQTSCIQAFPTILNQALDNELLRMRFPKLKLWGIKPLFCNDGRPVQVDVISGACIMIKRQVFEEIGMFSTEYFMYSEDVDLCYKIKKIGLKVYHHCKAQIIHHGGGSSRKKQNSNFQPVLIKESRMIYFRKTKGKFYATLYKNAILCVSFCRILLLYLMLPVKKSPFGYQEFNRSFEKWKKVMRWSLGLERWTKTISKEK